MKFTVVWSAEAEAELARLWLAAVERDVITRAAFDIEEKLGSDPLDAGESRVPDLRIHMGVTRTSLRCR